MNRRLLAVCSTAALLILAPIDSSAAGTKTRTTKATKPEVTRPRASTRNISSTSKRTGVPTTQKCATCPTEIAWNKKGHTVVRNAKNTKSLPCHPKNYVDPKIAVKYKAALRDMNRAGIKPQVTSTWRSSERQEELYRCTKSARCRRANPGIYRALPPGKSLHEAGFAVDMSGIASGPRGNKRLTTKGKRIVGIMRKNGFKWRYGLADPAHFEADPRKHGYRNVKQAIARTRTTCQVNLAKNKTNTRKTTSNKVAANRVQSPARARAPSEAATRTRRQAGKVRA